MIALSEEAGEKGRSVRIRKKISTALAQVQLYIAWL